MTGYLYRGSPRLAEINAMIMEWRAGRPEVMLRNHAETSPADAEAREVFAGLVRQASAASAHGQPLLSRCALAGPVSDEHEQVPQHSQGVMIHLLDVCGPGTGRQSAKWGTPRVSRCP